MDPVGTDSRNTRRARSWRRRLCIGLLAAAAPAFAYTVNISTGTRTLYLQVGNGSFTGTLQGGGSPGVNSTVNVVSVTVPAAQVGTGTAQAMTTNSTAANSFWDNFTFCSPPAQLYVGGFYRRANTTSGTGATLTASVPATLSNGSGGTISFSQISWTSSGIGDTGAQPFPAGTFVAGSTQTIGTIARNQWAESCLTFSYANSAVVPSGTYTGIVVYTLSAP
jgi:hypothetical protein